MDRYVCQLCSTVVYFGDKHPCFSNMDDETNYAVPHRSDPAFWGSEKRAENPTDSYGDICQASHHTSYNWRASTSNAHSIFYPRNKEVDEGAFEISRYFSNRYVPPRTTLHDPSRVSKVIQTLDSKQYSSAEAGPSGIRHHPLVPDVKRHYSGHLYGKQCEQKSSFDPHFMSHTAEAPNALGTCKKGISKEVNLAAYARTTAVQKLWACKFCGKEFTRKFDLNRHLRTHTGEKPFACKYCGKKFNKKFILITHTRTHTGEKLYKSDICGRCFSDHSSHRRHVHNQHRGKSFRCSVCGEIFGSNEHRNRHARQRHPISLSPHVMKLAE